MNVTPAILIRAAAALIRPEVPAIADWLHEQAAMTAPSPGALKVARTYLSEGAP